MVQAAVAGVDPLTFERMTLGEIGVVIEGYHAREKNSLINRINAILRGLAKRDHFNGLGIGGEAKKKLSEAVANRKWFWQPEGD